MLIRTLAIVLPLVLLAVSTSPASADKIRRGCAGLIYIVKNGNVPIPSRVTIAEMDASHVCNRPNNCRLEAGRAIRACAGEMWATRWTHRRPHSCRTTPQASGRSHFTFNWAGIYPRLPNGLNSLKDRIEATVCCRSPRPQGTNYSVRVIWMSEGNNGCGGSRRSKVDSGWFTDNYQINCPSLRANGLCR